VPNRIVKESICTSDTIDQLTWFEEAFFYRLIVNCDDHGRMDARPAILKARMFPLKSAKAVSEEDIKRTLNRLSGIELIMLYECSGRPYLQLITWENHQQIRAKKSKYPAYDSTCNQMISDDIKCPRNPIQSNPIQSNPIQSESNLCENLFNSFWDAYPRKTAKVKALKAWQKISPNEELLNTILSALSSQKESEEWRRDDGRYIPYPASWLNGRRWEDEVDEPEQPKQKKYRIIERDGQIYSVEVKDAGT
jgi:hypothetical protein